MGTCQLIDCTRYDFGNGGTYDKDALHVFDTDGSVGTS